MLTSVQNQPTTDQTSLTRKGGSSHLARLFTLKIDENLQVVILFSLLGIIISFALMRFLGPEMATWALSTG
jgi:hypothetical protein